MVATGGMNMPVRPTRLSEVCMHFVCRPTVLYLYVGCFMQ